MDPFNGVQQSLQVQHWMIGQMDLEVLQVEEILFGQNHFTVGKRLL